jgi:hypothetical protein
LAGKFHNLHTLVTGAGLGAADAFMAGAPAGYALSIDFAAPAGAPPPDYALTAEQRAVAAETQANGLPYRAAAAALALHLAPIVIYFAALALIALFFAGAAPSLWPEPERHRELGTEEGRLENVNVSVITAAELDRLHSSASREDQSARPGPLGPAETTPAEMQPAPAPPQPPSQEA